MKKQFLTVLYLILFLFILLIPNCKTAIIWSPLGNWTFSISLALGYISWSDTLTFSGSDSGGTVTGLTAFHQADPQTGTWTKTGDYTISMTFNFTFYSKIEIVHISGSSSEANPNSMSGSGTWQEDSLTLPATWNATKL